MSAYEYDNLPDTLIYQPVDEALRMAAWNLLHEVIRDGDELAWDVRAAHAYDRKGLMNLDPIGGPRNTAYGSEQDDVVLQLSVRVPYRTEGVKTLVKRAEVIARNAERQKALGELQDLENQQARVEAEIAAKRAELGL